MNEYINEWMNEKVNVYKIKCNLSKWNGTEELNRMGNRSFGIPFGK